MDLGAYANIDNLDGLMKANNIYVPRLRGLRLMKDELPMTEEEIRNEAKFIGLDDCEDLCYSNFSMHSRVRVFSNRTVRIKERYIILDKKKHPVSVNWKALHGKKRKLFRFCMKQEEKRVRKVYETFNKYCGENVLYIHARIGGDNWGYFGGAEIAKQPWFLEKVDDAFDCTYCDIYAKINEDTGIVVGDV